MERFEATLEEAQRGGVLVRVPPAVVEALGGGGRIAVQATFDGVPYRGSVVSMGGQKVIGVLKAIRGQLGKGPGDAITVTLQVDRAERSMTIPEDLQAALDAAGLTNAFKQLSFSHQRESVTSIEEAKKPETRARRIQQTIERLGS